jgi:hypothetical protein
MAVLHRVRPLAGFLSQTAFQLQAAAHKASLECELVASCCRITFDRPPGNSYFTARIRFHRGESMRLKFLFAMAVAFALSLGAVAQQTDSGIKQDTKDAAHSTGKAAKKTGHKIKKGTKKVVHKSADATEKGADKVKDKSAPTPTPPPNK